MEFRIESGSLLRAIAKSFLLTVITILAIFIGYIALLSLFLTAFAVMGVKFPVSLAFLWLLPEGLLLVPFKLPLLFSAFLLILFAIFLFPYFRRHDRLLIDDHGIRFDCRFRPLWSWHIAWEDIQLPITYHAPWKLFPKSVLPSDTLYIRLGNNLPNNPVFKLGMVSAWQADNKTGDAGTVKADNRLVVTQEIERYLGQDAVKKAFFKPSPLVKQARETQRKRRAPAYDLDKKICVLPEERPGE
jgi:hypothetical protein